MVDLPRTFINRMSQQLSVEIDDFVDSLTSEPTTSIRLNIMKDGKDVLGEILKSQVPWCHHGFTLAERPSFTLDPDFHAGRYYVQESSSMVLYHVLTYLFKDQDKDLRILDLCGAPGGKSTTILDFLEGNGTLVTNEVIQSRVRPLMDNIMKWGYHNAIVTNDDPSAFAKFHGLKFDCIVIDAPCSGEGMFRKDPKAVAEWSDDHVHHCAIRQKRILQDISHSINHGGYVIYSTCTYNEQENIDNVKWMVDELDLESIQMTLPDEWSISQLSKDEAYGYQFYPHKVAGEGFFLAVLRARHGSADRHKKQPKLRSPEKKELEVISSWIETEDLHLGIANNNDVYAYNEQTLETVNDMLGSFKVRYSGVRVGAINKTILIPDHALALSHSITIHQPSIELDKDDSLLYLRKELSQVVCETKGWTLIKYNGFGIGWIKNIGNRINNYLPNEWRIRMSK